MKRALGLIAGMAGFALGSVADAHTLQLQCKKTDATNIVCRTIFTDGEVGRNFDMQLVDENDKVLATGKSDVEGRYTFKAPAGEYNVVVVANKGHTASISSEDIW